MRTLQRADWDCSIAALSTLAGVRYDDVLAEVPRILAPPWRDRWLRGSRYGLYNREMVALAARIGVRLVPTQRVSRAEATGILRVHWQQRSARAKANPGGHAVTLVQGRILDPDPAIAANMPATAYRAIFRARFGALLELLRE